MSKEEKMKAIKIELPARLHKQVKRWLVECPASQSDMFCYLIDNLPNPPVLKPNSQLVNYLKEYKNVQALKKQFTGDDIKTFDLIAKGVVRPTPDEQKIIDRLLASPPIK